MRDVLLVVPLPPSGRRRHGCCCCCEGCSYRAGAADWIEDVAAAPLRSSPPASAAVVEMSVASAAVLGVLSDEYEDPRRGGTREAKGKVRLRRQRA